MTFPEFCAKQARRSALGAIGLVVVLVGGVGYLLHNRKKDGAAARKGQAS